jgi:fengycin family lipopeptide synthetase D
MYLFLFGEGKQTDLLMAGVSAGRVHKDLEQMMGYFLNTYYLRVSVDAHASVGAFCTQVKQTAKEALQHQLYPFEQVLEQLGNEKWLPTHRSLHETGITYQKSHYSIPVRLENETVLPFRAEPFAAPVQKVKDPLWWYFTETEDGIFADVHFATSMYSRSVVEEMGSRFCLLFSSLCNNGGTAIGHVIAGERQKEKPMQQFATKATQNIEEDF